MTAKKKTGDLLGFQRTSRRPAYEASLERTDRLTRAQRAARIRWLNRSFPAGGMGMSADTWFVFREATSTFIDGHFIATLVLTAAFAEHWMGGELHARGFQKEATAGLDACIRRSRQEGFWSEFLLDRLDRLRTTRNNYMHLRELGHQLGLASRSFGKRLDPHEVAEGDAKHALETMLTLVQQKPQ